MAGVIGEGEARKPASSLSFPFPDYAGHAGEQWYSFDYNNDVLDISHQKQKLKISAL